MSDSVTRTEKTRFSSVAEVAAFLQVSTQTIYRLVEDEKIPAFRIGRSVRIPDEAVHAYLDSARITHDELKAIARATKDRQRHQQDRLRAYREEEANRFLTSVRSTQAS